MEVQLETVREALQAQSGASVGPRWKRPGVLQLSPPLFHEDGDQVEVYLTANEADSDSLLLTDYGATAMRLSYRYELDTETRHEIFERIVRENRMESTEGVLLLEVKLEELYSGMMQFAQTAAKVSTMSYFRRETVVNLFYELLDEFIMRELQKYKPQKQHYPITEKEEYEVDYVLYPNGRPYYLFGVKDNAKARLATIACQQFQLKKLNFSSLAVHADFQRLSRKDQNRLTNSIDKQFTTLEDFKNQSVAYFERESLPH